MVRVAVKESPIHGFGTFSLRSIAKGGMIAAIDDSRVVTIEYLPLLDSWYIDEYKVKVTELLEKL